VPGVRAFARRGPRFVVRALYAPARSEARATVTLAIPGRCEMVAEEIRTTLAQGGGLKMKNNNEESDFWKFMLTRDLKGTGAVVLIMFAIVIAAVLTAIAVDDVDGTDKTTLVTGAFTLIGTLVGSYTGVRVGSKGTDDAQNTVSVLQKRLGETVEQSTIRTAELAAAIPDPQAARIALDRAEEKIRERRSEAPDKPDGTP
jgi:hypothetical protein